MFFLFLYIIYNIRNFFRLSVHKVVKDYAGIDKNYRYAIIKIRYVHMLCTTYSENDTNGVSP